MARGKIVVKLTIPFVRPDGGGSLLDIEGDTTGLVDGMSVDYHVVDGLAVIDSGLQSVAAESPTKGTIVVKLTIPFVRPAGGGSLLDIDGDTTGLIDGMSVDYHVVDGLAVIGSAPPVAAESPISIPNRAPARKAAKKAASTASSSRKAAKKSSAKPASSKKTVKRQATSKKAAKAATAKSVSKKVMKKAAVKSASSKKAIKKKASSKKKLK